jgi:UPF0716 protein FxsA
MPRILGLILALPVLEIVAFAIVASLIGVGKALLLQVAISAIGIAMIGSLIREARTKAARGGGILSFALDGSKGMRGLAGLLFAIPGFLTDIIGVLTLVPEVRARVRRLLGGAVATRTQRPGAQAPKQVETVDLDAGAWREVKPAQPRDR